MKERPILFNSEMVRAVLDGRKTQTRRVVKGNWLPIVEACMRVNGKWVWHTMEYDLMTPFGEIGDRLWVRETFREIECSCQSAPAELIPMRCEWGCKYGNHFIFAADPHPEYVSSGPWKPSIHMPRWASRILLEITDVRVQRLQDISEEDASAEGVGLCGEDGVSGWGVPGNEPSQWPSRYSRRWGFKDVWRTINGDRSWYENPWVWAITFKVVKQ